jgi:hypothetical protein
MAGVLQILERRFRSLQTIATGHTDMRKGMHGLALLVQEASAGIRSRAKSSYTADAVVR